MAKNKDYSDELTAKMPSEFNVLKEIEIKHKAGCEWESISPNASKEDIEASAATYGITYEDSMKYKSEWITAIRNSEDRYAK